LKEMLGHLDVCSKEWVIRQYDHEVQGASVIKPLTGVSNDGPSDAAVIKPVLESNRGCAIANGINVRYAAIDPYHMATAAIDEAMRNVVAVGGNPDHTAILDNFSWGSSNAPEPLGDLVRASQGCYDASMAYRVPFISGKDSLNNEYRAGGKLVRIPATLLISAMSVVDDVRKVVTMDAKSGGNLLCVIGITKKHLGGSVLLDLSGELGVSVPETDLETAKKTFDLMYKAINSGIITSCHDLSDGGLGVALAEMCFAGGIGCEVDLGDVLTDPLTLDVTDRDKFGEGLTDLEILYSETPSRFLVEIEADKKDDLFDLMTSADADIPVAVIGTLSFDDRMIIRDRLRTEYINETIADLKEAWQRPLRWE
ncbi:phosphoribosylformylglycinamidine synthase, partial [bacterium]|nr:phosphoribosylformylglycinamidine synthase [bacterium]